MNIDKLFGDNYPNSFLDFTLGGFNFCIKQYYKYRNPSDNGCVIFAVDPTSECHGFHEIEAPFFWFNIEKKIFTPFYQARRNHYGDIKNGDLFKGLNITFKEYKKIQKRLLNQVNEFVAQKCLEAEPSYQEQQILAAQLPETTEATKKRVIHKL